MARVCRLCVWIITALVLCKYSLADGNATDESTNGTVSHCHHHGNRDNCTVSAEDTLDTGQFNGHFSKCPEELTNYCIHGDCRYIKEQKAPSCRCQRGYNGARCEYLDLDLLIGEKRQIIIICVVAGLVLLILFIAFLCICSHRRWRPCWRRERRREEPRNGTEKLSMMDTSAGHTSLMADSTDPTHTNEKCV